MPQPVPDPPAFGLPGLPTDALLRAVPDAWVPCDEFAAASAALGYELLTGVSARLILMPGPGTDLAYPVFAQAAGDGIRLSVETGADWAYPNFPAPARLGTGAGPRTVTLVTSGSDDPPGEVITQGSSIPGAARFGRRWHGYVGFGCDPAVQQSISSLRVVDVHGHPTAPLAPPEPRPTASRVEVDQVVKELDAALPADSAVVCDAGSAHESVARVIARAGLRPVVQTTAWTAMGWSLGAALGVARALPGRPLGVVIGDGSFLMRLGDLAALVRYRVPAVVVLLVNGVMGQSRSEWPPEHRHLASLPDVDWAAAVTALGAHIAPDVAEAVRLCTTGPQVVLARTGVA